MTLASGFMLCIDAHTFQHFVLIAIIIMDFFSSPKRNSEKGGKEVILTLGTPHIKMYIFENATV